MDGFRSITGWASANLLSSVRAAGPRAEVLPWEITLKRRLRGARLLGDAGTIRREVARERYPVCAANELC